MAYLLQTVLPESLAFVSPAMPLKALGQAKFLGKTARKLLLNPVRESGSKKRVVPGDGGCIMKSDTGGEQVLLGRRKMLGLGQKILFSSLSTGYYLPHRDCCHAPWLLCNDRC